MVADLEKRHKSDVGSVIEDAQRTERPEEGERRSSLPGARVGEEWNQRQDIPTTSSPSPPRSKSPPSPGPDDDKQFSSEMRHHSPGRPSPPSSESPSSGESTPRPSKKQTSEEEFEKKVHELPHRLSIDDFELLKSMGSGTFARVWLVGSKNRTGDKARDVLALKVLRKADVIKMKQVHHIGSETQCLRAASEHPFVVPLIDTFSDAENLYILTEFCPGGELFRYLRRMKHFNLETTRIYAAEVAMALEFLHEMGIVYRDLKPENMLLGADGHLQLVDFGFAKEIHDEQTYTLCGTPEYFAPEVIRNHGHGLAVDWWGLGVLIYEFLVGQSPFCDPIPMRIYEQIIKCDLKFPDDFDPDARDIVSQLCRTELSERLGVIKGGAGKVKSHPFFKTIDWDALYQKKIPGPITPDVKNPADTENFDAPPPQMQYQTPYTGSMQKGNEEVFSEHF